MLILVAIGSFAIAVIFMSIFDVAVDTLLACFLIDEQSHSKAIYAPPELADLMDKWLNLIVSIIIMTNYLDLLITYQGLERLDTIRYDQSEIKISPQ